MSYTVSDLDEAIEEGAFLTESDEDDCSDYDEGGWDALVEALYESGVWNKESRTYEYANAKTVTIPDIGIISKVEEFGGEGQGDSYWVVIRVLDEAGDERLFRRNGWYASYSGGYFEGPTEEVAEAQQLITVYNPI